NGEDFWGIIRAFTNIGGYRLEWQLLNTSWFLPQNRERIYLIGHLANRSEPGVFPLGGGNIGAIKGATNSTVVRAITAGGHSGGHHSGMTLVRHRSDRPFLQGDIAPTIRNSDKGEIRIVTNTKAGFEEVKEGDSINFSVPTSKTRRGRVGKGKAQTLDTQCNQGVLVAQVSRTDEAKEKRKASGIRRLTEIECERLQGFPDGWTAYGNYDGVVKQISKTQRYKMCGNAVTTNVVRAIGERLNLL
ncbi:MAG TPA: DNA cytosine methyltransferase, partial [Mariniflexile sp.]